MTKIQYTLLPLLLFVSLSLMARSVNVKSYGAKGNGIADDALAIYKAVQSLHNGDVLYFPSGTYKVSIAKNNGSVIYLTERKSVTIKGDNATIVVTPNGFTHYNIICSENCNKLSIKGLKLCGDRLRHDYKTIKSTHEFGYGIYIVGNKAGKKSNITISDCGIYNMTGDAIVTKNGISSGKIVINGCILHHCRRQGVSILDSDEVQVENCQIHHIGTSDGITGTAPMAGIDIEPGSGTKIVNKVTITGTNIYQCGYLSIVGRPNKFYLTNSSIEDLSLHQNKINSVTPSGTINRVSFYTNSPRKHYYYAPEIAWKDCTISCQPLGESEYCEIYARELQGCNVTGWIDAKTDKCMLGCRAKAKNCTFDTVRIIHSNSFGLGSQENNTYQHCSFLLYSPPELPFQSCSFIQCRTDEKSSKRVKLKGCTTDNSVFKEKP